MKKIIVILIILAMATSQIGVLKVEAMSTSYYASNSVGVLKNLSLDGQSYEKVLDQSIVISDIQVENDIISINGKYVENKSNDKKSLSTPFKLQGKLFKSIDRENVYVGELVDELDNFNVIHFSIDNSLINNTINIEHVNDYFTLKKQFVKSFNVFDVVNKTTNNKSLINLYLLKDRDLIFMEEFIPLNVNLPAIEVLEKSLPAGELWFSRIVKPQGSVVIDTEDDILTIDKKLNKIPIKEIRVSLRKQIKETKDKNFNSEEISILNAASYKTVVKDKIYVAWSTLGSGTEAAHHMEEMKVRYEVYGPTSVNPGQGATDNSILTSNVKAEIRVTSQRTVTFNYNKTSSFERGYNTFVIGRNSNLLLDKNRDIEVRLLVGTPKTSTRTKYYDFFNKAQGSYTLINSGSINWSALLLDGINRIPVLGAATSLLSTADIQGTSTVSTDFFSTTQEVSSVASKPPVSTYMESAGHRFTLDSTLGTRFQRGVSENRNVIAQFRYFVGNNWGDTFEEKYYTNSITFSYTVNSVKY